MSDVLDYCCRALHEKPRRALIVGSQAMARTSQKQGIATTFIADQVFVESRLALEGQSLCNAVAGIDKARRAMEDDGIVVPIPGARVWSAVAFLSKPLSSVPGGACKDSSASTMLRPTWDMVVVDSSEHWFSPASWTYTTTRPEIRPLSELLSRGRSMLAFRDLVCPMQSGMPPLWRQDWAQFLKPAFYPPQNVTLSGQPWIIAIRNNEMITPGEDNWLQA